MLTKFQRGKIIGSHLLSVSVTKVAHVIQLSRATVSKVKNSYSASGKTSFDTHQGGIKLKLYDRRIRAMHGNMTKNKKTVAAKIT